MSKTKQLGEAVGAILGKLQIDEVLQFYSLIVPVLSHWDKQSAVT